MDIQAAHLLITIRTAQESAFPIQTQEHETNPKSWSSMFLEKSLTAGFPDTGDTYLGVEPKIVGCKTPKMDGENNGKPYEQMDDLG